MPATIIGLNTPKFGTEATMTGVVVQSATKTLNAERAEAMGNDGNVIAVVTYAPTAEITISGITVGATPPAIGAAMAVTGFSIGSSGRIGVDSVTINKTAEGFNEVEVTATQYPAIAAS